jgi:hypothetical protein
MKDSTFQPRLPLPPVDFPVSRDLAPKRLSDPAVQPKGNQLLIDDSGFQQSPKSQEFPFERTELPSLSVEVTHRSKVANDIDRLNECCEPTICEKDFPRMFSELRKLMLSPSPAVRMTSICRTIAENLGTTSGLHESMTGIMHRLW